MTGNRMFQSMGVLLFCITYPNRAGGCTACTPAGAGGYVYAMPTLRGSAHSAPDVKHDFSCVVQIRKILLFHFASEFVILDDRIQFAVAKPTCNIQVRGADARPPSVSYRCLRMNHGSVPLEYTNPSLK